MHRLWSIPDVLDVIARDIPNQDQQQMCAVSRSCWMAAAPLAWETIGVYGLLSLILGVNCEDCGVKFKHIPRAHAELIKGGPEVWPRFPIYAKFVKTFRLSTDRSCSVTKLLYTHWPPASPTALFPNLRNLSLSMEMGPDDSLDLLRIIESTLGPAVRELTIDVSGCLVDHTVPHLFQTLKSRGNNWLERLSLQYAGDDEFKPLELDQIILHSPRLRKLLINTHGAPNFYQTIVAASTLEDLGVLSIDAENYAFPLDVHLDLPVQGRFPALRILAIPIVANSLASLLSSIDSPDIQSLELKINYPIQLDKPRGTFQGTQHFHHLKLVKISCEPSLYEWEELVPLLSCSQMEHFEMWNAHKVDIFSDTTLDTTVAAWPKLHTLQIGGGGPNMENAPLLTLQGLECLAKHCPSLRHVYVSVDARGLSGADVQYVATTVKHLHLCYSWADDQEDRIACRISRMWPHHEKGQVWAHANFEAATRWARIWRRVEGLLRH